MSEKNPARFEGRAAAGIYQVKVVLCEITPPIWRQLRVRGDMNLGLLHAVIQVAMGWTNSHLHQFTIAQKYYADASLGLDEDSSGPPVLDENETLLMDVVPRQNESFFYEYDFGDSWAHCITVEKILPPDPAFHTFAECLDGGWACPPDDCGGVPGYQHLLEVIEDPEHEEYDEMMAWLGREFDPEAFDLKKTNSSLRQLKWPRTTVDQLAGVLMQRDMKKDKEVAVKKQLQDIVRGFRHRFFLNPYVDAAFTKCPKCEQSTRLRKFPLVILIEPGQFLVLNKQCRYCPACDLIIARKGQLESLMAQAFDKFRPKVVGNDYQAIGTLDRADWRGREQILPNPKTMIEKMYVFEDVWNFKVTGGWVPAHPRGK